MFFPLSVDFDIAFFAVLAEDHSLVGVHTRINEERSALLESVDGVGNCFSGTHADQHAVCPLGDLSAERSIFQKAVGHDGFSGGRGHYFAAETDETTGRDLEFQKLTTQMLFHFHHFATADADQFNHLSRSAVWNIDRKCFDRFAVLTVDLFADHMRLGDGEFIAFAPHGLNKDGDVQNAASADFESVAEFFHTQGNVAFRFFEKTLADVTAADEFAFLAEERGVVDAEHHGDGGFVDRDRRHGFRCGGVGNRVADVETFNADDRAEVAAVDMIGLFAFDSFKSKDLFDGSGNDPPVAFDDNDRTGGVERSAMNASDTDSADIIVVIQRGDLHLKRSFVDGRSWNAVEHGIHQRENGVAFAVFEVGRCPAVPSAGVEQWEIKLFIIGAEVDEEIKNIVVDFVRTRIGTVDLVDDDNRFQFGLQCFIQHETCLGQGTFGGIDEQDNAVCHIEDPLHLSAEIAVSRSVNDVDFGVPVTNTDIFCEDRNTPFPFEIVVVKETFVHFLIFAEEFGLLDDLVNERGFAMVNVCDDGDVSDVLHISVLGYRVVIPVLHKAYNIHSFLFFSSCRMIFP